MTHQLLRHWFAPGAQIFEQTFCGHLLAELKPRRGETDVVTICAICQHHLSKRPLPLPAPGIPASAAYEIIDH
jgi:hypothetical protein